MTRVPPRFSTLRAQAWIRAASAAAAAVLSGVGRGTLPLPVREAWAARQVLGAAAARGVAARISWAV